MMFQTFVDHWWLQAGRAVLVSLGIIVAWWSRMDIMQDRLRNPEGKSGEIYDFIVVGAGSAGNVVANRLSTEFRVLLLEAGGSPIPFSNIPFASTPLLNFPEIDWMHNTVKQKNCCLALLNQEAGWSQGKGLGGSGTTNFLIHSRGHPKDFDHWANLTGDPRWSYEGVLPFFKKSEDYGGDQWRDTGDHGSGGPMRIESFHDKFNGDLFVAAAQELGYKHVDVNGGFTEGFDTVTFPIKKGIRQSSYVAYTKSIRHRRNLVVKKYAHVTKILFRADENGQNVEAYGVQYDRHGQRYEAFANKEVIISAGIQSPKLLMLSGIGSKSELEPLGIKVKVDSPKVGKNTIDHISTYLGPFTVNKGASTLVDRDATAAAFMEYIRNGTGILTQSGVQAIGFVSSTVEKERATNEGDGPWPDIQLLFLGTHIYLDDGQDFARAFHIREDIMKMYADRINGGKPNVESFSIITSLARPRQRGEILLRSKNPKAPLIIDPKYFQDYPEDIKILVEGTQKAVQIVEESDTFRKIGAKFTDQPFPGCEKVPFKSDAYFECYVRQFSITLHHIVGTCAMGRGNSSETAVVDTELRVNGVKNLRVIDASVMPMVPVGNTNAGTIMVAERGVQFIVDKYATPDPGNFQRPDDGQTIQNQL